MAKRDYAAEYRKYHSSPAAIRARSNRNKARRQMEKEGRVKKGDGKDVDHKDGNPMNNSRSNLAVTSRSANRAKK